MIFPVQDQIVDGRIVITGGLGFLGSNLAHRLAAENEVVIIDALTPHSGGNRDNLDGIDSSVSLIERDLADVATYEGPVRAALQDATHVFHCAARTSHPGSMNEPLADLENNGRGTLFLLDRLRTLDSDARVVLPATTSQTGPMVRDPIDELHPETPRDIYSVHKSLQEKYLLVYAHSFGLDGVSVRLSNLYGPRAAIHSPALGFVNYFIGLGLKAADLTVYGEGQQRRSILYVDDAVDALLSAATTTGVAGEVFQVADPESITVQALAEAITRNIGGRVRNIPYPEDRVRTEIGDAVFSVTKAHERLGWSPRTGLDEGLQATAAFFRPRIDQYLVTA